MMTLHSRLALVAVLMGSAVPAALMAQTATAPAPEATTPAETPAATSPAPEATGTTATGVPANTATPGAAPASPASPTGPAAADPAAAAPVAAAPAAGGPPKPAASAAEAEIGGFYMDQTQGDWQIRCQKSVGGKDPCELYQLMKDEQGNSVAEVSMIPLSGKAAAGVTMVAPLETDLLPGLGFKVDAGKQMAYPFSFCSPVGCFSRVAFSQAEVDGLKKGSAVTVSLAPYGAPQGTRVDLKMSLKGFTAGWDAVKAKSPAPDAEPTAAPAAAAPAAAAPAAPAAN